MSRPQWFQHVEKKLIKAGSSEPIRRTGRFIRITEINGADMVTVEVDEGQAVKMSAGMESPDTVTPFSEFRLNNHNDVDITVSLYTSMNQTQDDRKHIEGTIEVLEPASNYQLVGKYYGNMSHIVGNPNRRKILFCCINGTGYIGTKEPNGIFGDALKPLRAGESWEITSAQDFACFGAPDFELTVMEVLA